MWISFRLSWKLMNWSMPRSPASTTVRRSRFPPLPDTNQWNDFEAARKVMIPNFNQVHAAERYRKAA